VHCRKFWPVARPAAARPATYVGVTISIHKLSAGSGYDYLTRQVAALDATEKGRVGLASYDTERGETPGAWIGAGMAGIDGLSAGNAVAAEQMRALFGAGMHPLAAERLEALAAADLADANIKAATRLGAPFRVYAGEVSPFRIEVAKRIATQHRAGGLGDHPGSAALRAGVRTEVAREFFRNELAAIRSMLARSLPPSRSSRVRAPRRSRAMT
jgi:hypothetical protein